MCVPRSAQRVIDTLSAKPSASKCFFFLFRRRSGFLQIKLEAFQVVHTDFFFFWQPPCLINNK